MDLFSLPMGATPIQDSSGLKMDWIKTREQLNAAEADNILKAATKYFFRRQIPSKWFHEAMLRDIHTEMFGKVWGWAGIYYQGPLRNIGIKSMHIPIQVRELCDTVHFWMKETSNLTFLEQSARIHFRLAQIHPFPNGNGRHARFCADLYLQCLHGQPPQWPEQILLSDCNLRKEYIQSLRLADQGDYLELVRIMQKYGAANPSIVDVLTQPFFQLHFPKKKMLETIQTLLNRGGIVGMTQKSMIQKLAQEAALQSQQGEWGGESLRLKR